TESDVRRYFEMVGSPGASAYSPTAPDPYMQKTESLDYVYVLQGDITLVLDTAEVELREGDTVIQRGTSHAWSNRTDAPCILVISSHGGSYEAPLPPLPERPEQALAVSPAPRRRVVTGLDREGRSCVTYDGNTPNVYQRPGGPSPFFSEFWTIETKPACLTGARDEGAADRMVAHSPPAAGANFRIVDASPNLATWNETQGARLSQPEQFEAMNTNGLSEHNDGGPGANFHRTPTVDYALNLGCDRILVLDDSETVMHRGDVVIQLGTWHTWLNRTGENGCMAFDMIGGEFSAP
ncbi:MAG: cupin domain-containing protein, partial [Proteobacteria bacterium]|nr:cupin domain-containing protein [Pseudomonadota bacterium]